MAALACVWLGAVSSETVIREPLANKTSFLPAALIIVQAPFVPNDRYVPLASALQEKADLCLWVAVPEFPANEPRPGMLDSVIQSTLEQLQQAKLSTNASLFMAGHGAGGITLQDWLAEEERVSVSNLKGQVLLGSYLQRKYRSSGYPLATLTLGGELDGLTRVTRLAEAYWHQVLRPPTPGSAARFPVTVLPGVSHMQFASGEAPAVIKARDLKPEASDSTAHELMALSMATFMANQSGSGLGGCDWMDEFKSLKTFTEDLLSPIVQAFVEEGYYQLMPPCYEASKGSDCFFGSAWSSQAQKIMSGLVLSKNISGLSDTDRLWPVNRIFPHDYLPEILNRCQQAAGCILNTTSVTQNVYSKINVDDTTIEPVSALQMEAKLSSRQRCYEHAAIKPAIFNETDGDRNCAEINAASYQLAVERSTPSTKARFLLSGQKMEMKKDRVIVVYPLWSGESLTINSTGQVATVTSVAMKFSTSNPIPLLSGLHFCKLLSPALAMEWVYIDGLRKNLSLIAK